MARRKKKVDYTYAVGRRKSAVARVRLFKGKEQSLVNDQPFGKFFPGEVFESIFKKPFKLVDMQGKMYVTVKVQGGGKTGQLEAVVHGVAKALSLFDPKLRELLKKEGFLTRDPRKKERRKVGTGGKARRKKQSPKR